MATKLTPEILKQLAALQPGQYGATLGNTFYQPVYASNAQGEAGMGQEGGLQQILGYDPTKTDVGQQYSMYGGGGDYQGQGQFKKVKDGDLMAMGLLSAFGMGMLPGAMAGGAGAAEGFGASLGLDASGLGGIGAEAGGVFGGGFAPSLSTSLAPEMLGAGFAGFSPEFAAAGLGGTLGGGMGAAAGGAFNAAADSQAANAAMAAAGADPAAGYAAAMNGGVTGSPISGGLLSSLTGGAGSALSGLGEAVGTGKGLLGLGATALGGLLGSKGQEGESSRTNKLDPRMDAMLYGADGTSGLLGQAMQLANQQMSNGGLNDRQRKGMAMQEAWLNSPEYAQGFNQMKNVGMGLLSRGIAANPFAK